MSMSVQVFGLSSWKDASQGSVNYCFISTFIGYDLTPLISRVECFFFYSAFSLFKKQGGENMIRIPYYKTVIPSIKIVKLKAPLFAQIELTKNCQYNCRFCYNFWKESENILPMKQMDREELFLVVDKLINCEIFSLIFSGGEPTLCESLPELIKLVSDHKIDTTVISNGANLTKAYLISLKQNGLQGFQISLHHFDPIKADIITQHRNSFKKTTSGVKNVIEVFGTDKMNVNMVVTKDTVDDVFKMGLFLNSIGVENFSVGLVSFSGHAVKNNLSADKDDLEKVYYQLKDLHFKTKMNVSFTGGMPICLFPEYGVSDVVGMSNVCDAAISQIVIGSDGGIRPCVEMPIVVGNAVTDDLKNVWQNSKELISIRKFENTPPSCYECNEVSLCHGGCRAAAFNYTGDVQGLDPLMEVKI